MCMADSIVLSSLGMVYYAGIMSSGLVEEGWIGMNSMCYKCGFC
jgi:hypothetical protein